MPAFPRWSRPGAHRHRAIFRGGEAPRGGPHSRRRRASFLAHATTASTALAALYSAWEVSEPGRGYGAKAADWQRKVDEIAPAGTASK